MKTRVLFASAVLCLTTGILGLRAAQDGDKAREWTATFAVERSELSPTGRNPFFILEPGYQLVLAGKEDDEEVRLTITVLDETRNVDGVETRVVEERESKDGEPVEISRNYFAISKRTNDVYYFGEDVDIYKDGKVISHRGAWLSGVGGAKFGLAGHPGLPAAGGALLPGASTGQGHGPCGGSQPLRGDGDTGRQVHQLPQD